MNMYTELRSGVYQGILLPHIANSLEDQVKGVRNLELRDSDLFVCTFPKSGSHWMWRILNMMASGSAEYKPLVAEISLIDVQTADKLALVESPRVMYTHYHFHMLPEQLVKNRKGRLVHVYRNPKAVLVSLAFFLKILDQSDLSLTETEEQIYTEKAPYGSMFPYFDRVIEFEKNNPEIDVIHVAYEDMKKDPAGTIKKLAQRLEMNLTDELCSQIADAASFDNQKKNETEHTDDPFQKNYYRKGEANDWKNHLTVAQSERMDEVIRARAPTCPFSRRYLE